MSNALAIATVTAVLRSRIVTELASHGLSGFDVTATHPRNDPRPGVYIALYRAVPNSALRNEELPTFRSDGSPATRPRLPLNLHYMLSFTGDVTALDAERLAGIVTTSLHAHPYLDRDEIRAFLSGLAANHPLRASDLADQSELVKLSPLALSLEDHNRVWSLSNQSFFALMMAWEASVVFLDATVEPRTSLPVQRTGIVVEPLRRPTLRRVREDATGLPVLHLGQTLRLEGTDLRADRALLRFGTELIELTPSDFDRDDIRMHVAASRGFRAGMTTVQVVHQTHVPGAAGDGIRRGVESNALPVVLVPTLGTPTADVEAGVRVVRVPIAPPVGAEQEAELRLESGSGAASSTDFRIDGGAVVFRTPDLAAGADRVRVIVDGAASVPDLDASGVYAGPTVTVP